MAPVWTAELFVVVSLGGNTGEEGLVIDEKNLLAQSGHLEHLARIGVCAAYENGAAAACLLSHYQWVEFGDCGAFQECDIAQIKYAGAVACCVLQAFHKAQCCETVVADATGKED